MCICQQAGTLNKVVQLEYRATERRPAILFVTELDEHNRIG